jgi:hypothetical protein
MTRVTAAAGSPGAGPTVRTRTGETRAGAIRAAPSQRQDGHQRRCTSPCNARDNTRSTGARRRAVSEPQRGHARPRGSVRRLTAALSVSGSTSTTSRYAMIRMITRLRGAHGRIAGTIYRRTERGIKPELSHRRPRAGQASRRSAGTGIGAPRKKGGTRRKKYACRMRAETRSSFHKWLKGIGFLVLWGAWQSSCAGKLHNMVSRGGGKLRGERRGEGGRSQQCAAAPSFLCVGMQPGQDSQRKTGSTVIAVAVSGRAVKHWTPPSVSLTLLSVCGVSKAPFLGLQHCS